jgi:hypothetical protein
MHKHPLVIGLALVCGFIGLAQGVAGFLPPAWADTLIPVPLTPIVISLGDLPPWIIAFIAGLGLWKSWRVEQHMVSVAADMHDVRHETNSMRTAIEAFRR